MWILSGARLLEVSKIQDNDSYNELIINGQAKAQGRLQTGDVIELGNAIFAGISSRYL